MGVEEIGKKRGEPSGGGDQLIGGFQVPSRRWRQRTEPQAKGETARKRHTRRVETKDQETERKKAKDRIGTGVIKTGILEYNMAGMLADEDVTEIRR